MLRKLACPPVKTAWLLWLVCWLSGSLYADKAVLMDGRTLQGRFAKIGTMSGDRLTIGTGEVQGLTPILMCDDDLKRTFIPNRQVREVLPGDDDVQELIRIEQHSRGEQAQVNHVGAILKIEPFDQYGRRTFHISTVQGPLPVIQGITAITPRWTRVKGLNYSWDMRIATNSIPFDQLQTILNKATDEQDEQERRSLVRFYLQSRRYKQAREELEAMIEDFPALRDRLAPIANDLVQMRARQILNEIEVRLDAGQYNFCKRLLADFPLDGVAGEILQTVRGMEDELREEDRRAQEAWDHFHRLLSQLKTEEQRQLIPMRDEIFARRNTFIADDFPSAIRFCSVLVEQWEDTHQTENSAEAIHPSVGRRIFELFNQEERQTTTAIVRNGLITADQGAIMLNGLNRLLTERKFYQQEDFMYVALPQEAKALLERGPEQLAEAEVMRLNRLLMEAAYPRDIARSNFTGLTVNNRLRLEAFLQFAEDNSLSADKRLALAISGWLLGSNAADTNLAVAMSRWQIRDLIREYLNEPLKIRRDRLIREIRSQEGSDPKAISKILSNMKPPVETPPQQLPNYFELQVETIQGEPPTTYFVHLPLEYDPHRQYPTVITLNGYATKPARSILNPSEKEAPTQMAWWAGEIGPDGYRNGQASRHGFIVIAPKWAKTEQREYGYTAREHAAVLGSLRDACRRFSIDTDRVFLSGHGMGADAVWDLGLAHPDLWAGIIPIVGRSDRYCYKYWPNAELLPIYSVGGELDADIVLNNAREYDRFMRRGFDVTVVEYRGRGHEHFGEEILDLFDWMKRKRRNFFPREFEVHSMRPWDNFFWWVEVDGLPPSSVVHPHEWEEEGKKRRPTNIEGSILASNGLRVRAGAEKVTVWLSPEVVDFDKPMDIRVGSRRLSQGRGRFVEPDIHVMLEDARTRADRRHPFWAKLSN